eukprot:TRINITY_DN1853_c0_g2_i2.p1 TRINITY_DN1853_c0_g2~~TRINITY_DN1853_c0_g2_i2.p1  ORF type:complete len:347 (+),score=65.44 TRINITY_DN1853_c0_g2_i2:58-1041(+)
MSSTDTSITGKRAEPERSNGKTADGESESHKLKHQRTKACHNLLRKTTARQLLESKSRKVIVLPHNKTVGEALHELSRHKITAAPVILQASLEDGEADTYMGIVDVRSILFHLMQDVLREEEEEKKKGVVTKSERVELLVKLGKRFVDRLLLTVSGNDTEFLLRGALDASLEEVICNGFFVHRKGETNKEHFPHVHRVTVFDMHGFVKGLISQSDIVRYLARHIGELGSIASTPLSELGITRSPVVTVLSTQTAMDALHVMHAKNVPAVAVVDGDGVLLANFSASDLTVQRMTRVCAMRTRKHALTRVSTHARTTHPHTPSTGHDGR